VIPTALLRKGEEGVLLATMMPIDEDLLVEIAGRTMMMTMSKRRKL